MKKGFSLKIILLLLTATTITGAANAQISQYTTALGDLDNSPAGYSFDTGANDTFFVWLSMEDNYNSQLEKYSIDASNKNLILEDSKDFGSSQGQGFTDTNSDKVVVTDSENIRVYRQSNLENLFNISVTSAKGVAISENDNVYVLNQSNEILHYDDSGSHISTTDLDNNIEGSISESAGEVYSDKDEIVFRGYGQGFVQSSHSSLLILDKSSMDVKTFFNETFLNSSIENHTDENGHPTHQIDVWDYSPDRNIAVAGYDINGTQDQQSCVDVFNASNKQRIYRDCSTLPYFASSHDRVREFTSVNINDDFNSVIATLSVFAGDSDANIKPRYAYFNLEPDDTLSYQFNVTGTGSPFALIPTDFGFESYVSTVFCGGFYRYCDAAYVVLDSEPSVSNIQTEPDPVEVGDLVNVTSDVISPADSITSVTLDVYQDGSLINSSLSMTDIDGDGNYNYTGLLTAEESLYNLNITAEDSQNRVFSENYTFSGQVFPPQIDSFTVNPLPEDNYDNATDYGVSLSWTERTYNVDQIQFFLYADGSLVDQTGPITPSGSSYSNSSLFDFQESYRGKSMEFRAVVNDTQENSAESTVTSVQADPPTFNFINPADNALFTTSTDVDVQFDYGGETSEEGNYVLLVNGFVEDTTSEVDGSNSEGIHTITYSPPVEAIWEINFDSTTTGNTYISDTFRTFYVREQAIDIQLDQPSPGATFNVDFGQSTTATFNWTEESGGYQQGYTSEIRIRNDSSNNIIESQSFSAQGNQEIDRSYTSGLLPDGSYTWIVESFDNSSTSSDLEQRSFTVEEPEPFTQSIDQPSDGTTFNIPLNENQRDVNVSYTVRPNTEDVSTDLLLDGNIVESQTTTTADGNTTYQTTLQNVGTGQHTLRLESQDAAGNNKNTESTFTIQKTGLFDLFINSPSPGQQIETSVDSNTTDVNSSYTVDVGSVNVTTTVTLNGQNIDQRTFNQHSTTQNFNLTFQDLSEQQYTINFTGTDTEGNTQFETRSFEVVPDDRPPEIVEFRSTPNLRNVRAGDSLDIFFFGTEGSDEIDYVNVTFYVNGTEEKHVQIPADELVQGSFQKQLTDFITINPAWTGLPFSIQIQAVDTAGRINDFSSGVFTVKENQPSASLTAPADGATKESQQGDNTQFQFTTITDDDVNLMRFYLRDDNDPNGSFILLDEINITGTGTTDRNRFYNMTEVFGHHFGNYSWRVNMYDATENKVHPSQTWSFELIPEQQAPILNILNPLNNDVVYAPRDTEEVDVQLTSEVLDTPEEGTVTIKLNGKKVHETQIGSGTTTVTDTERLSLGTYNYNVRFKSENYNVEKSYVFDVKENKPQNNTILLSEPEDGETLYQDAGGFFRWNLYANTTGETKAVIVDSSDNKIREFSQDYTKTGSQAIYQGFFNASSPTGTYTWWAKAELDNGETLVTENRSFSILDYQAPELLGVISPQNNTVVQQGDTINFTFNSETHQEQANVLLQVREQGSFQPQTVLNVSQAANTQEEISGSQSFAPGQYAWYIEWRTNPTFTSDEYFFTVESTEAQPPVMNLINPSQNDTFTPAPANITFDYNVEVFSQGDSTVKLRLARESTGLDNFTTLRTYQQNTADSTVSYSDTEELGEDAYFWKVTARYPNGTLFESDRVGFAVGENQTAPQPKPPEGDGGFAGIIGNFFVSVSGGIATAFSGLGATALFVLASIFTGISGVMVSRWTRHSEIGILAMAVSAITFVYLEWYQPWVGIILFLISAGIFIFSLRKIHGGE